MGKHKKKRQQDNHRMVIVKIQGISGVKRDLLHYEADQGRKLINAAIATMYFYGPEVKISTAGQGYLMNWAVHRAKGSVKSKLTLEQQEGHHKSIPYSSRKETFGRIRWESASKHFNLCIQCSHAYGGERAKPFYVLAKSFSHLNNMIKQGWVMSKYCTVYFDHTDSEWYAEVYLSKPVNISSPKKRSIGVDVGVNKITASSEGRKGNSLVKRLKYLRKAASEWQRQLALAKNKKDEKLVTHLESQLKNNKGNQKSIVKQLLDKEAKLLIARCLATSSNLIIEDPKVLANLKLRSYLVRWAKNYFAKRILVLGREASVFVLSVNPKYTSQTCNKCGWQARQNRNKERFCCVKCGHIDHADINAAKNLAWKGQQSVDTKIVPSLIKKGIINIQVP
jgi:hypothetical protein